MDLNHNIHHQNPLTNSLPGHNETDDEEILAKDIERVANGKKPTQDFSDRRFTVK